MSVTVTENGQSNTSTQQLTVLPKLDPSLSLSADTVFLDDGVMINVANTSDFASFVQHSYTQDGGDSGTLDGTPQKVY